MMWNPLRRPIVLMSLLCVMVGYVHWHHRQRSADDAEAVAEINAPLTLRMAADRQSASILRMRRESVAGRPDQRGKGSTQPVAATPTPLPLVESATPAPLTSTAPSGVMRPSRDEPRFIHAPRPQPRSDRSIPLATPRAAMSTESSPPADQTHRWIRGQPSPAAYTRRDSPQAAVGPLYHRVVDGDTLRSLAERYLGDANRYLEIFEANRDLLLRPDLLPLGEKLKIPRTHAAPSHDARVSAADAFPAVD